MKPSIHTTLPLIALTLAPLNATPISIVNPSFETPDLVTDTAAAVSGATWRRVGNGSNPLGLDSAGLAKRVGAGTFATILDPTPDTLDAEQALYLNGSTESVFQVLSATLEANTTYTLTVDAGDRTGLDFQACEIRLGTVADPLVSADFGANLLTGTVVSNTTPFNGDGANDGWQTWVTTFTTGPSPAGLGNPLRVELVTTGGIQSYFDNVRLDAEPASSDPTPPTLASTDIVDNQGGGPVTEDDVVIYTVTFSEDMDETTVDAADFGNAPAATATISVGTPTETAPGVFTIPVTPTSAGTLQLQVNASAVLTDVAGNPLNTTSAIADNDTLTVDADNVAPSLLSTDITDDQGGATIAAGTPVTYTLTFYESAISPNVEDMDASTVTAGDFGNAGTATITIGAITETSPGVFTIEVTPDTGGTLRFQVNASADLRDVAGNALDTSSAIIDDTTINVDGTNPTLAGADIVDNQGGASVIINTMVTYTVTFSEDMNAATVDFSDFSNAGSAPITIGTITETSPGVFTVQITPTGTGSLQLQVNSGAILTDVLGNPLDTTSAILDNDTITVTADVTNPVVVLLVPADNAGGVAANTNLSLTFDENVMKGSGDIVIKDSGGTPVHTIAVDDTTVSGATVMIDPPSDLAPGSGYYVEIPGTAITDLSGNPFAGISGSSAWNFTTSSATPISIVNPSFETPDLVTDGSSAVPGATWRRVGDGSNPLGLNAAGLAKRVGAGTFATILDPTPDLLDAEQSLYLNGPTESVFQVLTATLQANTTYTLTVDAGDRLGLDFQACEIRLGTVTDPLVSADFGANLLTGTVVSNTTPVNGVGANDGWQTWVTTFTTGPSPAGLGNPLRVEIVTTGGVQSYFDNVRLVAMPAGPPTTGFAGWQAANGTTGAINEDHDNDGVSNGIEYFLGGNTDTTGFTALPGVSNTGGTLSVTWVRHPDYPDFPGNYGTDFVVETSATLTGPWTEEASPGNVTITGNDVTYTFPAPLGAKNFARLKVTGP